MHLIIGLGNPGKRYAHTRHNVGFDVLTLLGEKLNLPIDRKRGGALVGEGVYRGQKLVLAAPMTFMNLSGESVQQLLRWYKCSLSQMLVVYDDIDLPLGKLRVRAGGSAGTHNGMRSILQHTGGGEFPRIRVGVGKPPEGWELADFVLSQYTADERQTQFDALSRAAEAALDFAEHGIEHTMQAFNKN